MSKVNFARGMRLGGLGGLASTMVMDIIGVGLLVMMGMQGGTFFSVIGKAAGNFFSIVGIAMGHGALLGVVVHYLVGSVLGFIFVAAVAMVDALQVETIKKGVVLGIIYTEVVSMVLLVPAAVILKMAGPELLQFFGLCFAFHLVYGAVLGGIVSQGMRSGRRSIGVSTRK
ncbi:MAG: hypothetical protein JSW15_06760 [Deltaproteobacteria bacterium]|nr:MAG: hypothetical protein JSW15_06760 [Deltaproteobacteria bacterium]